MTPDEVIPDSQEELERAEFLVESGMYGTVEGALRALRNMSQDEYQALHDLDSYLSDDD